MKKFFLILFTFFISIFSVFAEDGVNILPSQLGIVNSIGYIESNDAYTKQVVEVTLLNKPIKKQNRFSYSL